MMEILLTVLIVFTLAGGIKLFSSSGRNWKLEAEMMKCQAEALRMPKTEAQKAYDEFNATIFKINHPWADPENWGKSFAMNDIYFKMLCQLEPNKPTAPTALDYSTLNDAEI